MDHRRSVDRPNRAQPVDRERLRLQVETDRLRHEHADMERQIATLRAIRATGGQSVQSHQSPPGQDGSVPHLEYWDPLNETHPGPGPVAPSAHESSTSPYPTLTAPSAQWSALGPPASVSVRGGGRSSAGSDPWMQIEHSPPEWGFSSCSSSVSQSVSNSAEDRNFGRNSSTREKEEEANSHKINKNK